PSLLGGGDGVVGTRIATRFGAGLGTDHDDPHPARQGVFELARGTEAVLAGVGKRRRGRHARDHDRRVRARDRECGPDLQSPLVEYGHPTTERTRDPRCERFPPAVGRPRDHTRTPRRTRGSRRWPRTALSGRGHRYLVDGAGALYPDP